MESTRLTGRIHVEIRGKGVARCLGCRWWKWNGVSQSLHCLNRALPWFSFERSRGCPYRDPDENFDPKALEREIAALEAARKYKGETV